MANLYKEKCLLWTLYKIEIEKSARNVSNVCRDCVNENNVRKKLQVV